MEAANVSIQRIKLPHVFYKLQQVLKSGSGPRARASILVLGLVQQFYPISTPIRGRLGRGRETIKVCRID